MKNSICQLSLALFPAVLSVFLTPNLSLATPPGWAVRGHQAVDLPEATTSVQLTTGDLLKVETFVPPRCPPRAMCAPYQVAVVQFTLGCLNDVMVTGARLAEGRNGKPVLHLTALELVNPKSATVRCARANIKNVEVPLGKVSAMDLSDLELAFSNRIYLPK